MCAGTDTDLKQKCGNPYRETLYQAVPHFTDTHTHLYLNTMFMCICIWCEEQGSLTLVQKEKRELTENSQKATVNTPDHGTLF